MANLSLKTVIRDMSGQEIDKKPSLRYLVVHLRAIGEVAFQPHDPLEGITGTASEKLMIR